MATTAVANKKKTDPADIIPDNMLDMYDETMGEGADYDPDELIIPFLRIAQSLSPQLKKSKPEYIEGLEEGDLFNTVTGEIWKGKDGIDVIPCYQVTKYLEFVPRSAGGGFQGEVPPDHPDLDHLQRVESKELLPNGNELVRSDQHYCVVLGDDGVPSLAIVDMKSTQRKVSKRWKTQTNMLRVKHPKTGKLVRPALYGSVWHIATVDESNDKGDFKNYSVTRKGMVQDPELFSMAKDFRESILSGKAVAAAEDGSDTGHGDTNPNPRTETPDDEIPF